MLGNNVGISCAEMFPSFARGLLTCKRLFAISHETTIRLAFLYKCGSLPCVISWLSDFFQL